MKHSQVMIYLFFAHTVKSKRFRVSKVCKKCQRKVMAAAAAAVHYSILRSLSLTHSFGSATDIQMEEKRADYTTHNFGLKTITLKNISRYKQFRNFVFSARGCLPTFFFCDFIFVDFFYSFFMLMYHISDSSKSTIHGTKNLFHTHYAINFYERSLNFLSHSLFLCELF